ncbi:hypothetical protein ACEQ8H_002375 [Pleosporales sp. CAS-2024a]
MTSSESEVQAPSRKRSRTSEDGGKEGKKARGRPRVDTQDATAADRRRTQIRLAQRAYRQRKETTISSLKQQSTQLHSIIGQMGNAFLRVNESTLKSGLLQLNPGLARELKSATELFTTLARTARDLEAREDDNLKGAEQAEPAHIAQRQHTVALPAVEAPEVGWGYSTIPDRTDKDSQPVPTRTQPVNYFQSLNEGFTQTQNSNIDSRRQFTVGEVWDQSKNAFLQYQDTPATSQSSTQSQSTESLPFGMINMLNQNSSYASNPQIFSVNIPTPTVTPPSTRMPTPPPPLTSLTTQTLPSIYTYSHAETTFARRLTRATLEAGFQLLNVAHARPTRLHQVFKLSLPYLTLDQLRSRFKIMLSRSVSEELDFWETPFIHLGGAGTHYPRKNAQGRIIPKKNNWTVRQVGPLEKRMVRVENMDDGNFQYLPNVDLSGFEGEWFDAYDVQGYLEECWGCRLDPNSNFAECTIEDESQEGVYGYANRSGIGSETSPGLRYSNSTGSRQANSTSPPKDPISDTYFGLNVSFAQPAFQPHAVDVSYDQALGLDLAPGYNYSLAGSSRSRQTKKKVAWVEVSKFIDVLKYAVCLGRAPGFRRKDVDMAILKALVTI